MMEVCLESKEPASEEMGNIVVHQDVPEEETMVETVGALVDQYGD
jgi:hypothetical protein